MKWDSFSGYSRYLYAYQPMNVAENFINKCVRHCRIGKIVWKEIKNA